MGSNTAGRMVIVGGGYAGVLAALRASSRGRGRVEISLVSQGAELVERVRLHERAARERKVTVPLAELLRGTGVRLLQARVEGADLAARKVHTSAGPLGYDRLVLCAGSHTPRSPQSGASLRMEPEEVELLRERARALAARRGSLLVVGGGLTGVEVAAELKEALPELCVSLACGGTLAPMLHEPARRYARRVLERLGVRVREGAEVYQVREGGAETSLGFLEADLVVWTTGFGANELGRAAGLKVAEDGRCDVDEALHAVGAPEVFVAGDAARVRKPGGGFLAAGCKTAMPLGAHAGESAARELLGLPARPFDFRDTGVCVSLGRRDAVVDLASGSHFEGRFAVWIKEQICRYTVASLRWERAGWYEYRWLHHSERERRALSSGAQAPRLAS